MSKVLNYQVNPHLINGPHNPIFFRNVDLIKSAIEKMKLQPVVQSQRKMVEETKSYVEPWWIFGGMKIPHLHYEDQVYVLTTEQWRSFSKNLIETFSKNLQHANAVSFGDAMEIANNLESVV